MKYAFISEKNLILEAQSVDSCLCILILLNILILHPIFINWSVSLLLHKASFYKTKVTENVDECRWLHTQTWTWGTLVLEFLESLPFIFFLDWSQAAPGKGNENVPRSLTQILTGLELEIQRLLENISWINYFVYIRVNTFVKIWLDSFLSLQLILIKNTFQYPISYHWRKQL